MRVLHGLRGYIGLSLIWATILGVALFLARQPSGEPIEILPPPTAAPTASPTPGQLRVDVAGAVNVPGVYTLSAGSLVADAIAAAGGATADADLDRVNKAVVLQDGIQVYVPRLGQSVPTPINAPVPQSVTRSGQAAGAVRLVNLNTASLEELDTLPGVGPSLAQRIIEGRPYGAVEDLLRVKGIGQATFEKLKDLVTVK